MEGSAPQPPPPPGQRRRRPRVLLGATGSVATVKLPELAAKLAAHAEVRVVLTPPAEHFWQRSAAYAPEAWQAFQAMAAAVPVIRDTDEWAAWQALGDGVVHIELRAWADVLVVAPLSANTLAKLAQGLCDNLLTCVARAWDARKPVVVCPAMNTHMWEHPFTARHLRVLTDELGYTVVEPVAKLLACGDLGKGGLAAVDDIVAAVRALLPSPGAEEGGGEGRNGGGT